MMQIKGNSEVSPQALAGRRVRGLRERHSVGSFSGRTFKKENFVRWAVIRGSTGRRSSARTRTVSGSRGAPTTTTAPERCRRGDYVGSRGPADGTLEARRTGEIDGWIKAKESNPGSLAGVWATRNTRAAIWDALAAREAFVTSGPRIKPRFFGGAGLAARTPPRS